MPKFATRLRIAIHAAAIVTVTVVGVGLVARTASSGQSQVVAGHASSADVGTDDAVLVIANGWSLSDIGTAASLVAAGAGDAVLFAESPQDLGAAASQVAAAYQPGLVLLVGGLAVISEDIERELGVLVAGVRVERLAGRDRIHTAVLAAERSLSHRGADSVVIANGWSLSDVGTAASAVASGAAEAVLYAGRTELGGAAADALAEHAPSRVTIVGGTAALSAGVEREITEAAPGALVVRSGGATRTDTAALFALSAQEASHAVIAGGWSLFDVGIAAAHAAAVPRSLVLYAERAALGDATAGAFERTQFDQITFIGAPGTLPYSIQQHVAGLQPSASLGRITAPTHIDAAARAAAHALAGTGPFPDAALSAASREATGAADAIGDPWEGQLPSEWTADTAAWLAGEGAAAVETVVRSAALWGAEPDCAAIAADLDSVATPAEVTQAALLTPDELTAEILAAAVTALAHALAACDPTAAEHAEGAWHWALAYRRLLEIGAIP